jgi:hypothetical protein
VDGNGEDAHFWCGIHLGMREASLTFLTRGESRDLRGAAFALF